MEKETFLTCWENASTETKVDIWNRYAQEEDFENEIYTNDDYFFEEMFCGKPAEAVRASYFGNYKYSDNYVWFNGYGNLDSSDFADDMPIDVDTLFDYLVENQDILEGFDDFEECLETEEEEEEEVQESEYKEGDADTRTGEIFDNYYK